MPASDFRLHSGIWEYCDAAAIGTGLAQKRTLGPLSAPKELLGLTREALGSVLEQGLWLSPTLVARSGAGFSTREYIMLLEQPNGCPL